MRAAALYTHSLSYFNFIKEVTKCKMKMNARRDNKKKTENWKLKKKCREAHLNQTGPWTQRRLFNFYYYLFGLHWTSVRIKIKFLCNIRRVAAVLFSILSFCFDEILLQKLLRVVFFFFFCVKLTVYAIELIPIFYDFFFHFVLVCLNFCNWTIKCNIELFT